ncbi:MAG: hypothetical protein CMJ54_00185 [Planctomycetaceae bacterium]|nr:hypothetical protein [Planctomycetaceae bacterium]
MTRPLIHLGLHRTGSTWFQRNVLDGREGRPRHTFSDRAETTARIVLPRDLDFDTAATRRWIRDRITEAGDRGAPVIISNERFSGNPAAGWFDAERTARRLASVVPEARVLLVLREQHALLRSIWLQQIRIGGISGIEDFLRPLDPGDHRLPAFDPRFLEFDRYVALLDDIFGEQDVLVLPFEGLRDDPARHLERIEAFTGIALPAPPDTGPVFAAPSLLEAAALRRVNLLASRSSLHRAPPFPRLAGPGRRLARVLGRVATQAGETRRGRRVDRIIRTRLANLDLGASNRRLSSRLDVDLASFGWTT